MKPIYWILIGLAITGIVIAIVYSRNKKTVTNTEPAPMPAGGSTKNTIAADTKTTTSAVPAGAVSLTA